MNAAVFCYVGKLMDGTCNSVIADACLCYPQLVDLQLPGHHQELL